MPIPRLPSPSWPRDPAPHVQTVPSVFTVVVCALPAAIARALAKNDSATTWFVTVAELFAEFGSGRNPDTEGLFCNAVPGTASTLATIGKRTPESNGTRSRVLILPVTVEPEFVQVAVK